MVDIVHPVQDSESMPKVPQEVYQVLVQVFGLPPKPTNTFSGCTEGVPSRGPESGVGTQHRRPRHSSKASRVIRGKASSPTD